MYRKTLGDGSHRHMKIQDLLPQKAIDQVIPIMNRLQKNEINVSQGKEKILRVLEPHRQELLERGVVADYLAWYLAALATQGGGELGSQRIK
jgi:hypothetical protein